MHFVDEQHDITAFSADFIEHALQAFLEFTAIFRPGDQRPHVERHQAFVLQPVGHIAIGDAQREAFDHRCLADAGFADENRVVLGPPRQHLNGTADFLVAADNRIKLAITRGLREVTRIFVERIEIGLGPRGVGAAPLAGGFDNRVERLSRYPRCCQRLAGECGRRQRQRHQQPLDGDKTVLCLGGDLFGLVEHTNRIIVPIERLGAAARHLRDLGERLVGHLRRGFGAAAGSSDQIGGHAFFILEQGLEHMFGGDALVVVANGDGLR